MRPRGVLATTIAMGVLSLMGFFTLDWDSRFINPLIIAIPACIIIGYIALWFYWKGRNWARLLVLLTSVAAYSVYSTFGIIRTGAF